MAGVGLLHRDHDQRGRLALDRYRFHEHSVLQVDVQRVLHARARHAKVECLRFDQRRLAVAQAAGTLEADRRRQRAVECLRPLGTHRLGGEREVHHEKEGQHARRRLGARAHFHAEL
eukprot:588069-Prymnesium_polylepis.2